MHHATDDQVRFAIKYPALFKSVGVVLTGILLMHPAEVPSTLPFGQTSSSSAGWVGQRHSQLAPSKVPTKPAQARPPACEPGPVLPPPPPPPSPTRPAEQANGTTADSESRRSPRERAEANNSTAYTLNWVSTKGPIFNFASSCTYRWSWRRLYKAVITHHLKASAVQYEVSGCASFGGSIRGC